MLSKKDPEKVNYYFEDTVLYFTDSLTLPEINFYGLKLFRQIRHYPENELVIDLSKLEKMDSAGVVFLDHIKEKLPRKNINVIIKGAKKSIENMITSGRKQNLPESIKI